MIGEKMLEVPKTYGEAKDILKQFGIACDDYIFENSMRLVELNNEVYEKYNAEVR